MRPRMLRAEDGLAQTKCAPPAYTQRVGLSPEGHERTHAPQQIRDKKSLSVAQLDEQGLRLLQVKCVKALGEPAVDRSQ
jgi:hypothetical protein